MLDHSKTETELIKEKRKLNDAVIFENKITDQVSKIAASFTVRPPSGSFNVQTSSSLEGCTTLQIRASDSTKTKNKSSEFLVEEQRPILISLQDSLRDDFKSDYLEISNYTFNTEEQKSLDSEDLERRQIFDKFNKSEIETLIYFF